MLRMPTACLLLAGLHLFACTGRHQEKQAARKPYPALNTVDSNVTKDPSNTALSRIPVDLPKNSQGPRPLFDDEYRRPSNITVAGKDQPVVLQAKQGTHLYIPPNSFVLQSTGKAPSGPVTVEIREYYETSDILAAGLSTSAQGRMLETGGMVNITATADGQPCSLAPGSTAQVNFAQRQQGDRMRLFAGIPQPGGIDWQLVPLQVRQRVYWDDDESPIRSRMMLRGPRFSEGRWELKSKMKKLLRWPDNLEAPMTERTMLVHFTIGTYGTVDSAYVTDGASQQFDSLIVARLKKFGRWVPGICNDDTVRTAITQPVTYWWESETAYDTAVKMRLPNYWIDSLYPMNEYVQQDMTFSSPNLGWINCDRFYDDEREKVQLYVEHKQGADVKMIFHNIRSVLQGSSVDGIVDEFSNIPKGEPVTIVSIRREGNAYIFGSLTTRTGSFTVRSMAYVRTNQEGLRRKLQELDTRIGYAAAPVPGGPVRSNTDKVPASAADLAFVAMPFYTPGMRKSHRS